MTLYRTKFRRVNFGFNPPIEQTADVVFETDLPEDSQEFNDLMWTTMWKQNPHWSNSYNPIKNTAGWSSVLWDSTITKIKRRH